MFEHAHTCELVCLHISACVFKVCRGMFGYMCVHNALCEQTFIFACVRLCVHLRLVGVFMHICVGVFMLVC